MKKAKSPSAKTLARKAQEAALLAWGKGMRARFKADLREMFAKEKRARLGLREGSVGTGVKTTRWVLQAPGLEKKPRLSDLLLGDAEKKADGMLAQLRRSREQEVARAKAMARADAAHRPGGPGGTGITTGRNQVVAASLAVQKVKAVSAVSPAAMRYIDERGTVKGKLGAPVRENTYIPPGVREKVAQAVRTDSPVPTAPQPVSAEYAGGGWYEHRSTRRILWMRGLRNQAGLDRRGIPGKYLGNSATIGDGEYETFYLPDGKSFRRRVEILKPENYTLLRQWEDKAKEGGLKNIIWSYFFDIINQPYIFVRAMLALPPKSISGRGLNPQEKFENGMGGMTMIAQKALPIPSTALKGFSHKTRFQEYSKMTKGTYRSFDEMWRGFRNEKVFYNIERSKTDRIIQNALPYMNEFEREVEDTLKRMKNGNNF